MRTKLSFQESEPDMKAIVAVMVTVSSPSQDAFHMLWSDLPPVTAPQIFHLPLASCPLLPRALQSPTCGQQGCCGIALKWPPSMFVAFRDNANDAYMLLDCCMQALKCLPSFDLAKSSY